MGYLNDLANECHRTAEEKGFGFTSLPENLALIHQELSEVLQEYRTGHGYTEVYHSTGTNGQSKPEGIPIELADVLLRTLDLCASLGLDIDSAVREKMEYNRTRPYRHGGMRL